MIETDEVVRKGDVVVSRCIYNGKVEYNISNDLGEDITVSEQDIKNVIFLLKQLGIEAE